MKRTSLRRAAAAGLLFTLLSFSAVAAPSAAAPRVGDRAPAFALRDLSGKTRALGDFQGRVVVLYFAMWCSTCRANTVEIQQEIYLPWKDLGVQALAVDYLGNDQSELVSLARHLKLSYPILLDDGTLTGAFGSRMAFTLVIDRGGVLRYADFYDRSKVKALVAELVGAKVEASALGARAPRTPDERPRRPHTEPAESWRRPVQTIPGRAPNGYFGISVLSRPADLNGDGFPDLVVGSQPAEGKGVAVSVWYGGPHGFGADPDLTLTASHPGQRLGGSLLAEDMNGDGVQDLVIGDSWARGRRRTVSLYLGARQGLSKTPSWSARGASRGEDVEGAMAAGDLDGDGRADLVLAVHTGDGRGALHVYYGRPGGLSGEPDVVIRGIAERDGFGSSVEAADLDGDGLADLVIGAPGVNGEGISRGAAYLFRGRKGRLAGSLSARESDLVIEGESDMDELGSLVISAGDLDADGGPELAVAAIGSGRTGRRAGAVYLFRVPPRRSWPSSSRLPASQADRILADGGPGSLFGGSVSALGDLDGDGIDDLSVGAMNAQDDPARAGAVYIYRGARELRLAPPEVLLGTREDGRFGRGAAPLGGSRFLVTETGNGQQGVNSGAVHLFAFPRTSEQAECGVCGMRLDRYRHTRYEVLAKDGTRRVACGAQCGLRMEAELGEGLQSAKATDFISGRLAEAAGVFFVFGSEAVPDMWPSFIAFSRRASAERFQRGFGGEVLDHAAALERARRIR